MIRYVVGVAAVPVLGAMFALATYERGVLAAVVVSILLGIVNFVRIGRQADALRQLQDAQSERIEGLPPPPAG